MAAPAAYSKCSITQLLLLVVALTHAAAGYKTDDNLLATKHRVLHHHLMDEYDRNVLPVQQTNENITVNVSLSLGHIETLDEDTQVLYTLCWLRLTWRDFQLSWKPEDVRGLAEETHLPVAELWLPDITIQNSVSADILPSSHLSAAIDSTGQVTWHSQMTLGTYCHQVDLTRFPFDTQKYCSIELASTTYSSRQVSLMLDEHHFDLTELVETGEYQVIDSTAVKQTKLRAGGHNPIPYDAVVFSLTLKRQSTLSSHLILVPSFALSFVIPTAFILPPGSTERITLSVGLLIAHVILLSELTYYIPTGRHLTVPVIGQFFVANIILVSLSMVASSIVANLWSRGTKQSRGPHAIFQLVFLNRVICRLLCINQSAYGHRTGFDNPLSVIHRSTSAGSTEVMTSHLSQSADDVGFLQGQVTSEWRQLVDVIDRLLVVIFSAVIVILTLRFAQYL